MILYDVVLALHVIAVIAAFGVLFAWPWLPYGRPELHRARARILGVVVTRTAGVALVAGAYLATVGGLWAAPWVTVPLVILVVVLGVVGSYLTPTERRLAELAQTEGGGDPDRLRGRVNRAAALCAGLVAVATFFMVAKPFG
jgi:hypothetical protein